MKRIVLLIALLFPLSLYAVDGPLNVEHPAEVIGVATPDEIIGVTGLASGGASPDCSEDFTISGGDQTDVTTNTFFDTESDPGATAGLIVNDTNDTLQYTINAEDDDGYAVVGDDDLDCAINNVSEITIKGKIRLSHVLDICDGGPSMQRILTLFKSSGATNSIRVYLETDTGEDLNNIGILMFNDALGNSADEQDVSLSANTWYPFVLYFLAAESAGIGSFTINGVTASLSSIDNDTHLIDEFSVFYSTSWGAGANEPIIEFDDIEYYESDQR